jgi:hypothetical protein
MPQPKTPANLRPAFLIARALGVGWATPSRFIGKRHSVLGSGAKMAPKHRQKRTTPPTLALGARWHGPAQCEAWSLGVRSPRDRSDRRLRGDH